MAVIQTTINPVPRIEPFDMSPVGGAQLDKTALPRARLVFRLNGEDILAKGAGDTGRVRVINSLPPGFAYTFEYAYITIVVPTSQTDADHYSDNSAIGFALGDGEGVRQSQLFSRGIMPAVTLAGSQKIWEPLNPYQPPLFNRTFTTGNITLDAWDDDGVNATAAAEVSSLVTLLQFDIEQIFNVGLNFPLPVQVR